MTGTTSRTLRHYGNVGLLEPSRVGSNGMRYYDADALIRLQRILLLRDLGLGLTAIGEVLAQQTDVSSALNTHLEWLRSEHERIGRQTASIERTLAALKDGRELDMSEMLDGFDHTQYKEEVEQRWGKDAYAKSDAWYRSMSDAETADWKQLMQRLGEDWIAAAQAGEDPAGEVAQAIAARHVDWLRGIPGTPAHDPRGDLKGYVSGLATMYVADERFAANYGGIEGATFVRDTLEIYADENL